MTTYIALLRGINVGGRAKLSMRDLVATFESLGLRAVRTYVQSGNVIFESEDDDGAALAVRLQAAIGDRHGFVPATLVLTREALARAAAQNPFPEAEGEPATLHLFFLAAAPEGPKLEMLERLRAAGERYALVEGIFYLHAPEGFGRSKLAQQVERALGVPVTARNWRSVTQILALACG